MTASPKEHTTAIRTMFDSISPRYDLLNRILSFGLDIRWRKKVVAYLKTQSPELVIDLATGTGDLAIEIARQISGCHVVGVDLSPGMLEEATKKIVERKMVDRISLVEANGQNLPFPENFFSAATIAFGIRNYEDPKIGIQEIYRVLKPGGQLLILEFDMPKNGIFVGIYRFYFFRVLPFVGRIISRNKEAYRYLPTSVSTFNKEVDLRLIMSQSGFDNIIHKSCSFGIVSIYSGKKT